MDAALVKLCKLELISYVETGDFRRFEAAENAVETLVASAVSVQHKTDRLRQLSEQLADVTADRPECAALLRTVRRFVLRRLEETSVLDWLATAHASRQEPATPPLRFKDRPSKALGA